MPDIRVIRYFRIHRTKIADRQLMNIVVACQACEIFQFIGGYSQEVFEISRGLINIETCSEIGIMGCDTHRTFSGVTYAVLLAADSDQGGCPDGDRVRTESDSLGVIRRHPETARYQKRNVFSVVFVEALILIRM